MRKRLLLAAAALLVLGVALAGAAALWIVRSVDTPEVRRSMLERISAAAGTRVSARDVKIALLHGVTLRQVAVANPPPFKGDLLTADAFVLRYRLWPLLSGRLELTRLSLEKPALTLAMDSRGSFNYERLTASGSSRPRGTSSGVPIALVLSRLAVDDARIVVRDAKAPYVTVDGAGLDSSFEVAGDRIDGTGKLSAETIGLADALFVRRLTAPLTVSAGSLALAPIRAQLAGGSLSGEARVRFAGALAFDTDVSLRGAELSTLLKEAKAVQSASGALSAEAKVRGGAGLDTLEGNGRLQVRDCKVAHAPVMTLLAGILQVRELEHPEFKECRAEFTLGSGRARVPVLSLKGTSLELTGHGVTRLDTLAIDFDMVLALDRKLLDKVPVRELRSAFEDRSDGFATLPFKVTGTAAAPRTDLAARVGKAAAVEAAGSIFDKLFHRKKRP
jgi:type II secretion system protein N